MEEYISWRHGKYIDVVLAFPCRIKRNIKLSSHETN
jgi:hypothetical protein